MRPWWQTIRAYVAENVRTYSIYVTVVIIFCVVLWVLLWSLQQLPYFSNFPDPLNDFFPERLGFWKWLGFLISNVVILVGGLVSYLALIERDSRWLSLLGGIALIYVGGIAAGICLAAGLQDSDLPTIELVSGEKTDQVGLLSSSGETWHAACNGSVLTIPAGEVTDVGKIGRISDLDSSKAEKTEHTSKEPDQDCPPESGGTTEVNDTPETTNNYEVNNNYEINSFSGSGSITGDNRETVTVPKEP